MFPVVRSAAMRLTQRACRTQLQEPDIGNFFFGRGHPMKPYRVRLTHEILQALSLQKKLTSLPKSRLTTSEMSKFHTDEYDRCPQARGRRRGPTNLARTSAGTSRF